MSLCPHGYTENWDCPICECPCGSGLPCDQCACQGDPQSVAIAPRPSLPLGAQQPAPAAATNEALLAEFADLVLTVNAARTVA